MALSIKAQYVMLSEVIILMLSVIILNVIVLSVVIRNVVAPFKCVYFYLAFLVVSDWPTFFFITQVKKYVSLTGAVIWRDKLAANL